MKKHWTALLIAALLGWAGVAQAATAGFVPAPNVRDMAHDFSRNLIYVGNGTRILRWSIATRSFLPSIPISASTSLQGMDISPDGHLLAVADASYSSSQGWVYLVNLDTLAVTRKAFTKDYYDGGTWSVAFAADGTLLVTSRFQGSGWVAMRRLTLSTGAWSLVTGVRQDTMLAPSTDRKTIAYAEANISDGAWGLYDVPTRAVVSRNGYTNGTSWFNYTIATDALGSQFAIPTYGGTFLYNDVYQKVATVGEYAGARPLGAAYHPYRPVVFFSWAGTGQVRAYNANTRALVLTVPVATTFPTYGEEAYGPGRLKLSADGATMMVVVEGGVRYVELHAPLQASNVSATVASGVASPITLLGSIGSGDAVTYGVDQPQHGTVRLQGNTATYTSTPGYTGPDSFTYRARYGTAAVVSATVQVTVE